MYGKTKSIRNLLMSIEFNSIIRYACSVIISSNHSIFPNRTASTIKDHMNKGENSRKGQSSLSTTTHTQVTITKLSKR